MEGMGPSSSSPQPGSVYLDHAAATPVADEVAAAMEAVRREGFGNPSSPHGPGRLARKILEEARERIVPLLGGRRGDRLVFTSGATEANFLGILGLAGAAGGPGRCRFSARDHSSAGAAAAALTARGWQVARLPLLGDGTLAPDPDPEPPAVTILCATLVCGQSGGVEDVGRLATWAGGAGRFLHVDATQAVVCGPGAEAAVAAGAATVVVAPHKFGGPRGIGGLLVRGGVDLRPLVPGPQERGLRGGTEPVALAVGFARALELATAARGELATRLDAVRAGFEAALCAAAREASIEPVVIAATARRAPHISTIAFPGLDREAVVMAADLAGVAAATGTACASGASDPAPALVAMGLPDDVVRSAVRFSFGHGTTEALVATALERLRTVLGRMPGGGRPKPSALHDPRVQG
jgi:cysteine desulfurase